MRNPWLRRLAYLVGGIVALLLVAVGTVYAVTASRASRRYDVAARPVPVATDSATVARGAHLVESIGKCGECHGADSVAGSSSTTPRSAASSRRTSRRAAR